MNFLLFHFSAIILKMIKCRGDLLSGLGPNSFSPAAAFSSFSRESSPARAKLTGSPLLFFTVPVHPSSPRGERESEQRRAHGPPHARRDPRGRGHREATSPPPPLLIAALSPLGTLAANPKFPLSDPPWPRAPKLQFGRASPGSPSPSTYSSSSPSGASPGPSNEASAVVYVSFPAPPLRLLAVVSRRLSEPRSTTPAPLREPSSSSRSPSRRA